MSLVEALNSLIQTHDEPPEKLQYVIESCDAFVKEAALGSSTSSATNKQFESKVIRAPPGLEPVTCLKLAAQLPISYGVYRLLLFMGSTTPAGISGQAFVVLSSLLSTWIEAGIIDNERSLRDVYTYAEKALPMDEGGQVEARQQRVGRLMVLRALIELQYFTTPVGRKETLPRIIGPLRSFLEAPGFCVYAGDLAVSVILRLGIEDPESPALALLFRDLAADVKTIMKSTVSSLAASRGASAHLVPKAVLLMSLDAAEVAGKKLPAALEPALGAIRRDIAKWVRSLVAVGATISVVCHSPLAEFWPLLFQSITRWRTVLNTKAVGLWEMFWKQLDAVCFNPKLLENIPGTKDGLKRFGPELQATGLMVMIKGLNCIRVLAAIQGKTGFPVDAAEDITVALTVCQGGLKYWLAGLSVTSNYVASYAFLLLRHLVLGSMPSSSELWQSTLEVYYRAEGQDFPTALKNNPSRAGSAASLLAGQSLTPWDGMAAVHHALPFDPEASEIFLSRDVYAAAFQTSLQLSAVQCDLIFASLRRICSTEVRVSRTVMNELVALFGPKDVSLEFFRQCFQEAIGQSVNSANPVAGLLAPIKALCTAMAPMTELSPIPVTAVLLSLCVGAGGRNGWRPESPEVTEWYCPLPTGTPEQWEASRPQVRTLFNELCKQLRVRLLGLVYRYETDPARALDVVKFVLQAIGELSAELLGLHTPIKQLKLKGMKQGNELLLALCALPAPLFAVGALISLGPDIFRSQSQLISEYNTEFEKLNFVAMELHGIINKGNPTTAEVTRVVQQLATLSLEVPILRSDVVASMSDEEQAVVKFMRQCAAPLAMAQALVTRISEIAIPLAGPEATENLWTTVYGDKGLTHGENALHDKSSEGSSEEDADGMTDGEHDKEDESDIEGDSVGEDESDCDSSDAEDSTDENAKILRALDGISKESIVSGEDEPMEGDEEVVNLQSTEALLNFLTEETEAEKTKRLVFLERRKEQLRTRRSAVRDHASLAHGRRVRSLKLLETKLKDQMTDLPSQPLTDQLEFLAITLNKLNDLWPSVQQASTTGQPKNETARHSAELRVAWKTRVEKFLKEMLISLRKAAAAVDGKACRKAQKGHFENVLADYAQLVKVTKQLLVTHRSISEQSWRNLALALDTVTILGEKLAPTGNRLTPKQAMAALEENDASEFAGVWEILQGSGRAQFHPHGICCSQCKQDDRAETSNQCTVVSMAEMVVLNVAMTLMDSNKNTRLPCLNKLLRGMMEVCPVRLNSVVSEVVVEKTTIKSLRLEALSLFQQAAKRANRV